MNPGLGQEAKTLKSESLTSIKLSNTQILEFVAEKASKKTTVCKLKGPLEKTERDRQTHRRTGTDDCEHLARLHFLTWSKPKSLIDRNLALAGVCQNM